MRSSILPSLTRAFSLIEQARVALNLANELLSDTSSAPSPPDFPAPKAPKAPTPRSPSWFLALRSKYGTQPFTRKQIRADFPLLPLSTLGTISTFAKKRPRSLRVVGRGRYQFLC